MAGEVRIIGADKLKSDLKQLLLALSAEGRRALLEGGNIVMTEAKTKRFRRVASPNKMIPNPAGGPKKMLHPPVPGILTMRTGQYLRAIGPPMVAGVGRVIVAGRVPYADVHEDDRPVLTKALEDTEQQIADKVGVAVYAGIDRNWQVGP